MNRLAASGAVLAVVLVGTLTSTAVVSAKPKPPPPEPPKPPPAYTVVEIPTIGTHDGSSVSAINEAGQVAGGVYQGTLAGPSWVPQGFLWDRVNGIRILGSHNGRDVLAWRLNETAAVAAATVGWLYNPATPGLWQPDSGFKPLSTAGYAGGVAVDVNDAGQVAGYLGNELARAVRWASPDDVEFLGTLGTGVTSTAAAINRAGQIVGRAHIDAIFSHAFLWDEHAGMRDLGTLGGSLSTATDINDLGDVVGWADEGTSSYSRAFLWTAGRMTAIGPEISFANAINNSGHVVGQFLDPTTFVYRAFVYRNGQVVDLNTLIGSTGVLLNEARDINDAGWIVANGTNAQGQERGFLLIPL